MNYRDEFLFNFPFRSLLTPAQEKAYALAEADLLAKQQAIEDHLKSVEARIDPPTEQNLIEDLLPPKDLPEDWIELWPAMKHMGRDEFAKFGEVYKAHFASLTSFHELQQRLMKALETGQRPQSM